MAHEVGSLEVRHASTGNVRSVTYIMTDMLRETDVTVVLVGYFVSFIDGSKLNSPHRPP
jgi:hypothetical protein